MTDPITIFTGLANLGKVALEMASTADAAKRNALLIEFQQMLIESNTLTASEQSRNAALLARNRELEAEIVQLKDWSAEREKYKLTEVAAGVFAQVEKGYMGNLQSAHKFCATCFNHGIKTPLQLGRITEGRQLSLTCAPCKSTVIFRHFIERQP